MNRTGFGARTILALVPAIFSYLLLGAHFLRSFELLFVLGALVLPLLLLIPRPWAARVVQITLVLGAFEWLMTMLEDVAARRSFGESYGRLVLILLAVTFFTLFSALLLETRGPRRRYGLRTGRFFETAPISEEGSATADEGQ